MSVSPTKLWEKTYSRGGDVADNSNSSKQDSANPDRAAASSSGNFQNKKSVITHTPSFMEIYQRGGTKEACFVNKVH